MSEPDSPNTASAQAKKAELEDLFRKWDDRGGDDGIHDAEPGAGEARISIMTFGVRLRLIVTLVLIGITALVMMSSWDRLAYYLQPDTPVELGDLRARWRAGNKVFAGESNRYVSVENLVVTRELIAQPDESEGPNAEIPEDASRLFFCPLYNLVVRTNRPLPDKPRHRTASIELDEAFLPLVQNRMALPYDLAVSWSGAGRLVSGADPPAEMVRPLNHYARRVKIPKEQMWVLIDGDTPEEHGLTALLWVLAAIVPLVALAFLLRAIRLRARARERLLEEAKA